MFSVLETTSNHLSLEELSGLHSWEGFWVIQGVMEELEEPGRWDGEPGVRATVLHLFFISAHFWLASFCRQTLSRWHRWWGRYPPAPWLYNLIFSNTRGKGIYYSQHLYMGPRVDSVWLSLDATPTPLPINVSRVRELPHLVKAGSHDHSCAQEGPDSVTGRREVEGKYARQPKQYSAQSITEPHSLLIFL